MLCLCHKKIQNTFAERPITTEKNHTDFTRINTVFINAKKELYLACE